MDDCLKYIISNSLDDIDLAQFPNQPVESSQELLIASFEQVIVNSASPSCGGHNRLEAIAMRSTSQDTGLAGARKKSANNRVTYKSSEDEKLARRRARFNSDSDSKRNFKNDHGFVSRGEDTRLQDSETEREEYFLHILSQFIRFTSTRSSKELHDTFQKTREMDPENFASAQCSVEEEEEEEEEEEKKDGEKKQEKEAAAVTIDSITMSLRKLRESLLYLPPSQLHKKVFLFSIRISHYFKHYQTYIPSIMYLLEHSEALGLSDLEIEEIVVILVLHICHMNNDASSAIANFFEYIPQRMDVLKIIRCWISKDYYTWINIYNNVESFAIKSMMKIGMTRMINCMIESLSNSYYNMSRRVIENDLLPHDLTYETFVQNFAPGWSIAEESDLVTIRARKMFRFYGNDDGDSSRPKLPNSIKIDDITSGRIDPQLIYDEIERLKAEINILRNEMSMFLKALATIPETGSQQEYYETIIRRLQTVQQSIVQYCERYNKLLPIINLAQIKLGHEVEAPPAAAAKGGTLSTPSTSNNTPVMGTKTTPALNSETTPKTIANDGSASIMKNGKKPIRKTTTTTTTTTPK
ncbi:hypothetical protein KGF56_001570 [Candida oxycetoniae]|uniref:Uncharacterized protein n=1 Tax=Candida oxycetoniae TaxID=497107 RepID=A0AAI9SZC2_9ASCO|nr:uncharacterized protein KGF56_001570 [Candida oxycetoniae]KAI3405552.2 hypothetical protein KGF56_001570 [Candida oxycetoniae]